jgi:hypothetical protein
MERANLLLKQTGPVQIDVHAATSGPALLAA